MKYLLSRTRTYLLNLIFSSGNQFKLLDHIFNLNSCFFISGSQALGGSSRLSNEKPRKFRKPPALFPRPNAKGSPRLLEASNRFSMSCMWSNPNLNTQIRTYFKSFQLPVICFGVAEFVAARYL